MTREGQSFDFRQSSRDSAILREITRELRCTPDEVADAVRKLVARRDALIAQIAARESD